jgi:hypothetical protein
MVEIKAAIRLKDLEGKAGIAFKALLGIEGSKKARAQKGILAAFLEEIALM